MLLSKPKFKCSTAVNVSTLYKLSEERHNIPTMHLFYSIVLSMGEVVLTHMTVRAAGVICAVSALLLDGAMA